MFPKEPGNQGGSGTACEGQSSKGDPARQLLTAVKYLHDQEGVIFHRDIEPENVLIDKKNVKLADFGLSQVLNGFKIYLLGGTSGYVCPVSERMLVEFTLGTGQ